MRSLRKPYRIALLYVLGILFLVAFDALVDLVLPPHRIRWVHNLGQSVSTAIVVISILVYSNSQKNKRA
jgi:hypothetical protein